MHRLCSKSVSNAILDMLMVEKLQKKMKKQNKPLKINKLICGDNLEALSKIPEGSVDLIYIDPPFFTNKKYEVIWGDEAEVRSYKDRWEGGIEHYIGWLKPRVQAMYDALSPTGSFYIHCDWHANAHIRIMLDEIFGVKNFRNEIIWKRSSGSGGKSAGNKFTSNHDTIFIYSKDSKKSFYKQLYYPITNEWIKKNSFNENGELWYWSHYGRKEKRKVSDRKGTRMDDMWTDIDSINEGIRGKKERLGYPTQKPEALLERIIKASSNKGDVVADFFCGCGTTVAVAQRLGRNWIGVDISPTAIKVMERRLKKDIRAEEGVNYNVIGLPTTITDVKKLEHFEFQNWAVIDKMGARSSKKKVGDMGIDGYYPKGHLFIAGGAGIQVKQSEKVGRNVVDNFETALKRAGYKKGYIVAFSFTKGAYEEVARVKSKEGLEIKLITVKDLLEKKKPIS